MTTLQQAKETAKILSEKKGLDIKVIEISDVSVIADYMVIATGNSSTHVKALADELEFQLKGMGISVHHIEGHRSESWILMDYTDTAFASYRDSHFRFCNRIHSGSYERNLQIDVT